METTPINCNQFEVAGFHAEYDIRFRSVCSFAHFKDLPPPEKNEFEWRIPNFVQLHNSNDRLKYENSSYFVIEEGVSRFYLNLKPCGESEMGNKSFSLYLFIDGYGKTNFPNTEYSLAIINYVDWRASRFRFSTSTFTDQKIGYGWENFLTYRDLQSKEFWSRSGEMIIRARVLLDMTASNRRTLDTRADVVAKHIAEQENKMLKNKLNKMEEDLKKAQKQIEETKSDAQKWNQQLLEDLQDLKKLAKDEKPDTEGHSQRMQDMAIEFNNILLKLQERVIKVKHEEGGENP